MKRLTQIHWRKSAVILLAATMAAPLAIVACGGATDTTTPSAGDDGQDEVFTIGIPVDVTTGNPWAILGPGSSQYNTYVYANRHTSLYGLSDQVFRWVPSVADDFPTDLEREGDFWVRTVKIKDGITWSDGEALDANDVAFTFDTALDFELTGNWTGLVRPDFTDRVEAIDDLTVKFYFKTVDARGNEQIPGLAVWEYAVSGTPIYAEHFWKPLVDAIEPASCADDDTECKNNRRTALNELDASQEPIVGPVSFVQREDGAFIALERNDDSYIRDSKTTQFADGTVVDDILGEEFRYEGTGDGSPAEVVLEVNKPIDAEQTVFSVFSNQDAAVLALRDGEVDYFLSPLGLTTGLRSQLENEPGISLVSNPSDGFRYLGFNFNREPLNDRAFRQAVAILIDQAHITGNVLQNAVTALYTPVPSAVGVFHNANAPEIGNIQLDPDDPEFQAQAINLRTCELMEGTRTKEAREVRIERAVAVLKEAGYTWETEPTYDACNRAVVPGEGLLKPDGTPITQRERLLPDGTTETINTPIEILAPTHGYDPFRATSALLIERWLQDAGIPVRARLTGFNPIVDIVFNQATEEGTPLNDFDIWILGWGLGVYPDHLVTFFTEANAGVGGFNGGNFVNAEFEALASEFSQELDIDEAVRLAHEMQDLLANELPYIVLFTSPVIESYRGDKIELAFTENFGGIQDLFGAAEGALATTTVRTQ